MNLEDAVQVQQEEFAHNKYYIIRQEHDGLEWYCIPSTKTQALDDICRRDKSYIIEDNIIEVDFKLRKRF